MEEKIIFSEDGRRLTCGEMEVASGNVFELGGWQSYLGGEDLTFAKNRNQELLYAYDFYHVAVKNVVVGYMIGYDKNMPYSTAYANAYDRVYEVIDFAVDCGDLDERCGELLIEYAKHLARKRGCLAVVVKHVEEYHTFNRFMAQKMGAQEKGDFFFLPIGRRNGESGQIATGWEFIHAKEGEKITTESLYFLKAAGLSVGESVCERVFQNGDKITVDRKSGEIFYPKYIKNFGAPPNVNEELDRAALYYICLYIDGGGIEEMKLNVPYACGDGKTRVVGAFHDKTAVLFEGEGEYVFDGETKTKYGEQPYRLSKEDERELFYALEEEGETKLVRTFGGIFNFVMGTVEQKSTCLPLFIRLRNLEKKEDEETPKKSSLQRFRDLTERFAFFQSLTVWDGEKLSSVTADGDGLVYQNEKGERVRVDAAQEKKRFLNRLQTIAAADWEKFYQSPCEVAWRVEMTFSDGEPLAFEGEGAYPLVWKRLTDLLDGYDHRK